MPRYEYIGGTSKKFWEIEYEGAKVVVRFGRIGSKGQQRAKTFDNVWKARNYRMDQIRAKLKKGYKIVRPGMPGPDPNAAHNPELEAIIAADPERPDGYMVYGDWLQTQGDPRGELITVESALLRSPRRKDLLRERARLRAPYEERLRGLAQAFGWQPALKMEKRMTAEWRLGFIHKASVEHDWYADQDPSSDVMDNWAFFATLLSQPSLRLLQDLTVGLWRDSAGQCEYSSFFEALGEHGLPALRRLFVGDYDYPDHIEISWTNLGKVAPLYAAAPRLLELTLQGGNMDLGDAIDLPDLRSFEVRTGGLHRENIQAIAAARWPKLERLVIWFGDSYYGFDGSVEDIAPILAGEGIPNLRHLGLMNADFTDALCQGLAGAGVLDRLESLDLSMGMMTDQGAQALVAARDRLKNLQTLDVSDNYLTSAGEKLLSQPGLGPKVYTGRQKEPDVYDDEVNRYVTVGE